MFGPWLHLAADSGQLGVAKRLVAMGVDVNARGGVAKGTALREATSAGHLDVIDLLLSCGAELDTSQPERNPLFAAISGGHSSVASLLLGKGIDPHVTYVLDDGRRRNALSYANRRGQTEIADLLKAAGCIVPAETLRDANKEARQKLLAALSVLFGDTSELALPELFPVDDDSHIAVHVIRPSDKHRCLTLFTTGISDLPMSIPDGQDEYRYAELLIHLPATWPLEPDANEEFTWPIAWLRKIAYYPHSAGTWLGGRHTIISNDEPPEPFAPSTGLSCMLLIADFEGWTPLKISDDKRVHFYTLVPIYAEERDLEIRLGVLELLRRFERANVTTIVDVSRVNVAHQE